MPATLMIALLCHTPVAAAPAPAKAAEPELKRPSAALIPAATKRPDPSVAKAIKAELTRTQTALTLSNYPSAVSALEQSLRLARAQAPLEVTQLTVVNEVPEGLGMYQPVPGAQVFGGLLRLYAEVRNFVPREVEGGHEVQLVTDAFFYYEDGEFIAGSTGIGEHRFTASTRHDVTFMVIELHTTGMPPQPYWLELVVTDKVSGKKARARTRFVTVGAPQ